MSAVAIRADGLGKRYVLGRILDPHRTLREALTDGAVGAWRAASRLARRGGRADEALDFWALRDATFDVARGEAVGLIGGNGAGKSTLLKLLSRITAPTEGQAQIRGRVGSLLEVGTGFHPDLTGRENVFLNGAILGMRRSEIARKFDEIVAFAEVERFIDTQVKRYSSGMYLRLAFAVAAHLEPEVLLVDEVLAVGDAAFQRRCLGKMQDVMEQGRTVIFVSHNMTAVQSLCQRALWLRDGRVADDGPARAVVGRYLQVAQVERIEQWWPDPLTAPGTEAVRLRSARVRPQERPSALDDGAGGITTRTPLQLEFEYWNLVPDAALNLSVHLYNAQGVLVFNALPVTERTWHGRPFPVGLFRDICHIPGDLLNDGVYRVELLAVRDVGTILFRHPDVLTFEVRDSPEVRTGWYGRWNGVVRPIVPWSTELVQPGPPAPAPEQTTR